MTYIITNFIPLPKVIINYIILPYLGISNNPNISSPETDYNIGFYGLISRLEQVKNKYDCFEGACAGGNEEIVGEMLFRGIYRYEAGLAAACKSKTIFLELLKKGEEVDFAMLRDLNDSIERIIVNANSGWDRVDIPCSNCGLHNIHEHLYSLD